MLNRRIHFFSTAFFQVFKNQDRQLCGNYINLLWFLNLAYCLVGRTPFRTPINLTLFCLQVSNKDTIYLFICECSIHLQYLYFIHAFSFCYLIYLYILGQRVCFDGDYFNQLCCFYYWYRGGRVHDIRLRIMKYVSL